MLFADLLDPAQIAGKTIQLRTDHQLDIRIQRKALLQRLRALKDKDALVFQIIVIMVLPALLGVDGIWFSIVAAEVMALFVTLGFLFTKRGKYRY